MPSQHFDFISLLTLLRLVCNFLNYLKCVFVWRRNMEFVTNLCCDTINAYDAETKKCGSIVTLFKNYKYSFMAS